jgi:CheY-like chemotaxis protein
MAGERILIIEDEPDIVELIKTRVESVGYRTIAAYDGVEGLEMAKKELPDLILLDILMPKMDGITVAMRLKKMEETKHIPIIIVSVTKGPDEEGIAKKIGVDDYLYKPLDAEELLGKIAKVLKRRKR